jgi:ferredoxin
MMGLTGGVKNLFGGVVGIRKPRLHLQAGTDKAFFALMLLELAEQIRPALTLVDAITAMEGEGPGSGDPVHVGALLAGASPLAVDTVATALVGLAPEAVWTQRIALQTGRPGCRLEQVDILGDRLEELRVRGFRPAKVTDVNFGLPPLLKNVLKNSLTARPVPDLECCKRCGICVESCPPQAMTITGGELHIDYQRCIRCFCCQELCPHGALLTRQGLLLRLAAFLKGR